MLLIVFGWKHRCSRCFKRSLASVAIGAIDAVHLRNDGSTCRGGEAVSPKMDGENNGKPYQNG